MAIEAPALQPSRPRSLSVRIVAGLTLAAVVVVALAPEAVARSAVLAPACRGLGWALVAAVAIGGWRSRAARQARGHRLLAVAAGVGVVAATLAWLAATESGRPPLGPEGFEALAVAVCHALVSGAFLSIEVSRRRWRRSVRATIDSVLFGLLGLAWVAPVLVGAVRPGLPAIALACEVVASVASAAAAGLAAVDTSRRGRIPWLVAAVSLAALALIQFVSTAVVHGSAGAARLEGGFTLLALGAFATVVARGLLGQPPVRPGIRAVSAWWRGEWWVLALAATALVALAVEAILAPEAHPALADRLRAVALVVGAMLMLGRAGLLRADVVASLRALETAQPGPFAPDRMAALAELSRIVAHEVRNSLSVLYAAASMLRSEPESAHRAEALASLEGEADRMASLVDELSAFARGDSGNAEAIPLYELVRDAADRARAHLAWPEGAEIDASLPPASFVVLGDWLRLETALAALLVACAQCGARRVSLRVGRRELDGRAFGDVLVTGDRGDVTAAMLAQGTPFSGEHGSRPGGSALGLTVARRGIEDHGGRVTLQATPTGALCARAELPLASPDAGDASSVAR